MPIPTVTDHKLAVIDNHHSLVMTRLRTLSFASDENRDPRGVREALQEYVDKVMTFVSQL